MEALAGPIKTGGPFYNIEIRYCNSLQIRYYLPKAYLVAMLLLANPTPSRCVTLTPNDFGQNKRFIRVPTELFTGIIYFIA